MFPLTASKEKSKDAFPENRSAALIRAFPLERSGSARIPTRHDRFFLAPNAQEAAGKPGVTGSSYRFFLTPDNLKKSSQRNGKPNQSALSCPEMRYFDVFCDWDKGQDHFDTNPLSEATRFSRLTYSYALFKHENPLPADHISGWEEFKAFIKVDIHEFSDWISRLVPRSVHDFKPLIVLLKAALRSVSQKDLHFFLKKVKILEGGLKEEQRRSAELRGALGSWIEVVDRGEWSVGYAVQELQLQEKQMELKELQELMEAQRTTEYAAKGVKALTNLRAKKSDEKMLMLNQEEAKKGLQHSLRHALTQLTSAQTELEQLRGDLKSKGGRAAAWGGEAGGAWLPGGVEAGGAMSGGGGGRARRLGRRRAAPCREVEAGRRHGRGRRRSAPCSGGGGGAMSGGGGRAAAWRGGEVGGAMWGGGVAAPCPEVEAGGAVSGEVRRAAPACREVGGRRLQAWEVEAGGATWGRQAGGAHRWMAAPVSGGEAGGAHNGRRAAPCPGGGGGRRRVGEVEAGGAMLRR
ncbi:hypothetical protein CYMTET_20582 [Cymbomonas tetramitiformis]|uniref:Uncharacterized protein n=1 Tax=Cymbomonas tetramitiformis TaxID=36881 RepID=A0AAE0G410_9CHLO|nr:hypothetical protein CYMTET_20582 [Cymbomonas tetramitiformis]